MKIDKQYVPFGIIFFFIAINVYIAAFNWDVYSTILNIEMGFGKVPMPPFVFLFLLGLSLMIIIWFYEYRKDMNNHIAFMERETKINLLQKDMEIERLKWKANSPEKEVVVSENTSLKEANTSNFETEEVN